MRYIIPGVPVPLQRPRFSERKCYDPQKVAKTIAQGILEEQHGDQDMYSGPLLLDIIYFMPYPQRAKRTEAKPHIFRPDLSNLIKFTEDVAIGVLYNDDCLICEIHAFKYYDENPRTEFSIIRMGA
jgi:Holliday junction resolvase RusA-like endonuclease